MSTWVVVATAVPVAVLGGAALAVAVRTRRARRPARPRPYVPTRAQVDWANGRRAEIDTESTIIIPAGEAGTSPAQWDGMIRRSFSDDPRRRL